MSSSTTSSEPHAAYAAGLAAFLLLFTGGLALLSLWQEPLEGDLTRIGRYLEEDFGPSEPLEAFDLPAFSTAAVPGGIVVFGDSFSLDQRQAWTSYLASTTGLPVAAFHHSQISLAALRPELERAKPRLFVYQIVARSLKERFPAPSACPKAGRAAPPRLRLSPSPSTARPRTRPRAKPWREAAPGYAGEWAWVNLKRALGLRQTDARVLPLRRPLFSSRRSSDLLFFAGDLDAAGWTDEDWSRITAGLSCLQHEVEALGIPFAAMVMPDKLQAYAPELAAPARVADPWARLEAAGVRQVRADAALRRLVAEGARDVFLPNDTHLGPRGARAAADELVARLKAWGWAR